MITAGVKVMRWDGMGAAVGSETRIADLSSLTGKLYLRRPAE